ncbi:MAG: hypothetical protein P4L99_19020 [Chthoniobacter sp.]|nr:hypothetical protein [Chthoniobacter sp.]
MLTLLQISSLFANDAQSTPASVDAVVKQRIALLTQIVEYTKKQYDMGEVTEEQILNTTLELYALSRDSSKSKAEQITWQERIIAVEQKKKASIDHQAASGIVGSVDALRAAERVLAAEQKLLELKAAK